MIKLDYCYHTHTARCGHAKGTDEAFVQEAIKNKIKVLGFSDHIFLEGVVRKTNRGTIDQLDEYLNSIKSLKEKYKDQIDIHTGFEAEYLPKYLNYYKQLLDSKKIEYLILGQHSRVIDNKIFFYHFYKVKLFGAIRYTNDTIKGIKSGMFLYLAHPDFYSQYYPNNRLFYKHFARRILRCASKYNMPIEINLYGIAKNIEAHHTYPNETFWKLASKYDVKVVIGYDSHTPEHFSNANVDKAFEIINKYNLKTTTIKL